MSERREGLVLGAGLLACALLGPLTLLLALAGAAASRGRSRRPLLVSLLPALALEAILWPGERGEVMALGPLIHSRAASGPGGLLAAAAPHLALLWVETLPLTPLASLGALAWAARAERGDPDAASRAALERAERRVGRRSAAGKPAGELAGCAFLGYRLGGDALLPERRGRVYLPFDRLGQHLLVVGATGSGKTETVLRLVDSVARASDWRIVFLDGKGDRETAERFAALAGSAGRALSRFPEAAHDGWRGEGPEIAGRLLQLVDFAQEGGGAYYRDLAVHAVSLACGAAAGPPRSSLELLRRLRREALAELHPPGSPAAAEVAALGREQLDGVRARYAAFFASVGGLLDGRGSFDEIDCAYFLLDGLRLKHEAGALARFLVEDFTQWAVGRKPRGERVLLVVDEFSAIATAGKGLVDVVERMRAFGVAAVLCPQLAEGMGSAEAAARLIGSARTILLHALPTPERFVEAAGGRRVAQTTRQLEGDAPTGRGSTRPGREQRIDADEVRRLKPGQCFAIGSGLALKLQVAPVLIGQDGKPAPEFEIGGRVAVGRGRR